MQAVVEGADQQDGTASDARAIAKMMRAGLYRAGACETIRSQKKMRMLLDNRKRYSQGDRNSECPARHFAQLRSQVGHDWEGEV